MKLYNILQGLNENARRDWLKDVVKAYKKIKPSARKIDSKTLLKQMPMHSLMIFLLHQFISRPDLLGIKDRR